MYWNNLGAQVEGTTTLKAAKEAASEMSEVTYAEQLHLDRLLGGKKSDQWCGSYLGLSTAVCPSGVLVIPPVCSACLRKCACPFCTSAHWYS